MEKFRESLRRSIRLTIIYSIAVLALVGLGIYHIVTGTVDDMGHINIFVTGFSIGIWAVMLAITAKNSRALKDEAKLRELYIKENDERNKFIDAKIGGTGINIVIGGLALVGIGSGYYNETVFITLMCAMVFACLVKIVLKAYYNKTI